MSNKFKMYNLVVDNDGHMYMITGIEAELKDLTKIKYECFNLLTREFIKLPEGRLESWSNEKFNQIYWAKMLPDSMLNGFNSAISNQLRNVIIISRSIGTVDANFWVSHCMVSIRDHFNTLLERNQYYELEQMLYTIHEGMSI